MDYWYLIDSGMLLVITVASILEIVLTVSVIKDEVRTRKYLAALFGTKKKRRRKRRKSRKTRKAKLKVVNGGGDE